MKVTSILSIAGLAAGSMNMAVASQVTSIAASDTHTQADVLQIQITHQNGTKPELFKRFRQAKSDNEKPETSSG